MVRRKKQTTEGTTVKPAPRRAARARHPAGYQVQNTRSRTRDDMREAKAPGKRTSKNGRVYYEYRSNRSDIDSEVAAYRRYVEMREKARAEKAKEKEAKRNAREAKKRERMAEKKLNKTVKKTESRQSTF